MKTTIYSKTLQGRLALQGRCQTIGLKERQLLQMVDGRRNLSMLGTMFPNLQVNELLEHMAQAGLVHNVSQVHFAVSAPIVKPHALHAANHQVAMEVALG